MWGILSEKIREEKGGKIMLKIEEITRLLGIKKKS